MRGSLTVQSVNTSWILAPTQARLPKKSVFSTCWGLGVCLQPDSAFRKSVHSIIYSRTDLRYIPKTWVAFRKAGLDSRLKCRAIYVAFLYSPMQRTLDAAQQENESWFQLRIVLQFIYSVMRKLGIPVAVLSFGQGMTWLENARSMTLSSCLGQNHGRQVLMAYVHDI